MTVPLAPPQNIKAEQSVLGAMLLYDTTIPQIIETGLRPEHFYRDWHGRVYAAILDLHDQGERVDALSVIERLGRDSAAHIEALTISVPNLGAYREHAAIVRRKARWRNRLTGIYGALAAAHGEDTEAWADALATLDADSERQQRGMGAADEFVAWYESDHQGIPLPFADLTDYVGGGLRPGEVTVLGGWSRMGKSLLSMQMLLTARRAGYRVHEYANEMNGPARTARLIGALTGIPTPRLRRKRLNSEEWKRVLAVLNELPYETTPTEGWSVDDYCRELRRHRWDLAAIDTVTNLGCRDVPEWDDAVVRLADAAARAGTHLIEVSQLNQARDRDKLQPPPTGRDLRNTGTWFQRARVVMFLHRDQELVDERAGIRQETDEGHIRIDKASHHDGEGKAIVPVVLNGRWLRFEPTDDYDGRHLVAA